LGRRPGQAQASGAQQVRDQVPLGGGKGGVVPGGQLRRRQRRPAREEEGLLLGVDLAVAVGGAGLLLYAREGGVVEARQLAHPREIVVARQEDHLVRRVVREPGQQRQPVIRRPR